MGNFPNVFTNTDYFSGGDEMLSHNLTTKYDLILINDEISPECLKYCIKLLKKKGMIYLCTKTPLQIRFGSWWTRYFSEKCLDKYIKQKTQILNLLFESLNVHSYKTYNKLLKYNYEDYKTKYGFSDREIIYILFNCEKDEGRISIKKTKQYVNKFGSQTMYLFKY